MKAARWLILMAALLFSTLTLASDSDQRLLAVYLGRFAEYVQFPSEHQQQEEFVIAVLGQSSFAAQLQTFYQNRQIHKKPVRLVSAAEVNDLPACDLLFINLPTKSARDAAIAQAAKFRALTISTARGFALQGGIIQISFVEQKAKITINHTAAVRNGIHIRAPLLSISTVLQGEQP